MATDTSKVLRQMSDERKSYDKASLRLVTRGV